jgi:hypothetical protein
MQFALVYLNLRLELFVFDKSDLTFDTARDFKASER